MFKAYIYLAYIDQQAAILFDTAPNSVLNTYLAQIVHKSHSVVPRTSIRELQ